MATQSVGQAERRPKCPEVGNAVTGGSLVSALSGAEACRRMMLAVETLTDIEGAPDPHVPDDDGIRRDYLRADQAISAALDGFAANRGFRLALANYLLTVHSAGTPAMENWTAQRLLDDGGYRPPEMQAAGSGASPSGAEALTISKDIAMVGLDACWEIEALCEMVRDLAESTGHSSDDLRPFLQMRGLISRIERLNSAVMSVLDDDEEIGRLQKKVLGKVLPKGVAHG